jgi:acetyl/propionyl-CoA carboxylase alpha subunit
VVVDGEVLEVHVSDGARQRPRVRPGQLRRRPAAPGADAGKVVAVLVDIGQRVERGAGLVVLEAMKMENEFRATGAGV